MISTLPPLHPKHKSQGDEGWRLITSPLAHSLSLRGERELSVKLTNVRNTNYKFFHGNFAARFASIE